MSPSAPPKGYRERPASEMQLLFDSMRDARPTVTRCVACGWTHEGTAADGREAAKLHREEAHPDLAVRRRHRLTPEQQRDRAMARSEWRRRKLSGGE